MTTERSYETCLLADSRSYTVQSSLFLSHSPLPSKHLVPDQPHICNLTCVNTFSGREKDVTLYLQYLISAHYFIQPKQTNLFQGVCQYQSRLVTNKPYKK